MTSSSILIVMRVLPGEEFPRLASRDLGEGGWWGDYSWSETVRLTESTWIYIIYIYVIKTKVHS